MDEWYEPCLEREPEEEEPVINIHEYRDVEEHVVHVYEQIKDYTLETEPLLMKHMDLSNLALFLYTDTYIKYVTSTEEGPRLF